MNFTQTALDTIAEKALEYKLGARGLRSICEAILTDAMFELPSQRDVEVFEVDKHYVMDKLTKSKPNVHNSNCISICVLNKKTKDEIK